MQPLPEWDLVLSAAARLQRILPDAVLVRGTASAIHAHHRFSRDADHVLTDLRVCFDAVLNQLEFVAGGRRRVYNGLYKFSAAWMGSRLACGN